MFYPNVNETMSIILTCELTIPWARDACPGTRKCRTRTSLRSRLQIVKCTTTNRPISLPFRFTTLYGRTSPVISCRPPFIHCLPASRKTNLSSVFMCLRPSRRRANECDQLCSRFIYRSCRLFYHWMSNTLNSLLIP